MKKILFFLIFFVMPGTAFTQAITGTVTDRETGEPIGYASIGVTGSGAGAVSRRDGTYSIRTGGEATAADTLKFYMIGYEPLDIALSELSGSATLNVALVPKSYDAGKVTVKPVSYKRRVYGNEIESSLIGVGLDTAKGSAFELGTLLNFKREALLEKFSMKVDKSSFEKIILRLNVYRRTGELEFENVLTEPIYIELGEIPRPKTVEIDLTPYNIYVDGETLVSIEHIEDTLTGQLYFLGSLTGSVTYGRRGIGSKWTKWGIRLPFLVTAKVVK